MDEFDRRQVCRSHVTYAYTTHPSSCKDIICCTACAVLSQIFNRGPLLLLVDDFSWSEGAAVQLWSVAAWLVRNGRFICPQANAFRNQSIAGNPTSKAFWLTGNPCCYSGYTINVRAWSFAMMDMRLGDEEFMIRSPDVQRK